jgi:hypothetical protein
MANYYNRITEINVSVIQAPQPSNLLNTAAIISVGGTTISTGSTQFIASASDLAQYLVTPTAISSISWDTGTVTVATSAAHGITVGNTAEVEISGVTPAAYNGVYLVTATTTTNFTYALASNPGTETVLGVVTLSPALYLTAADATWWGQGNSQTGYYIFEAGSTTPATIISNLSAYLTANPQTVYNWAFLPGIDADETDLKAFLLEYNAYSSLITFYLPVSSATYASWASQNTLQNTVAVIQSPNASPASELDSIAFDQYMTAFKPSAANRLPPSQYRIVNAVTAYSPLTATSINSFINGNINFIGTGAEGGISNTIFIPGKTLNGTPINVKYSVDWTQVNINLAISNAVINGSNNTVNPLYYDQNGINTLQQVAATVGNQAIQNGLALGSVITTGLAPSDFIAAVDAGEFAGNFVINAVPFQTYVSANPADFANQIYGGFTVAYTPNYGFETIVFNVLVTQFA